MIDYMSIKLDQKTFIEAFQKKQEKFLSFSFSFGSLNEKAISAGFQDYADFVIQRTMFIKLTTLPLEASKCQQQ